MWHLGMWFSSEQGSAGVMVGPDHLKGLYQLKKKKIYDSPKPGQHLHIPTAPVTPGIWGGSRALGTPVLGPTRCQHRDRAQCHCCSCTADCAAALLLASGTGQTLLEEPLQDSQSLRSSAFRWGTENCKEIWQGSRNIANKGLATWRNTCKAALRAECL